MPPARIESPELIAIGDGVILHEHAWLGVQRRSGLPGPSLHLADKVHFQRFVKVVCFGSIRIGEQVVLSERVYVSDVEYEPGHAEVLPGRRPLTDPQPISIGDRAFVGVGAIIKPGITIGELAYVGAGAIVTEDVPPRTLVVGAPARPVRRWDV